MRIATLQFNPTLGAVEANMARATALLASLPPLDLLVLPEMAFTGYNFRNLEAITPHLEPTAAGPTTAWAVATATRLRCAVTVGYPETATGAAVAAPPANYNASVTVSPHGRVLLHYRKAFLYYSDESWAREGPGPGDGDGGGDASRTPFFCGPLPGLGVVAHGICMDINPYRFTAAWGEYEFATCAVRGGARLVVLSMAWLTRLAAEELGREPGRPDLETVAYWIERLRPLVDGETAGGEGEGVVVVVANRCGTERNEGGKTTLASGEVVDLGDPVCYAGSSCVMKLSGGRVNIFGGEDGPAIMGRADEGVLVVDTKEIARYALTSG